jgi:lysozyme
MEEAIEIAASLCKYFEGFSATPYICPAGLPTIGYGTVFKPDGSKVDMKHEKISKETAEAWLMHELRYNYMAGVLRISPHLINSPKILAAMTSFAYNLGVPRYRSSTLRKRVDSMDKPEIKNELMKWVRGGGKVLPGLVKRRQTEASLI